MWIKSLHLKNLRNFKKAEFKFEPGSNLILGPNASGKSSLLEAIYFLAYGVSSRTRLSTELIRWGANEAVVQTRVEKEKLNLVQSLGVGLSATSRKYWVGEKQKSLADFWSHLRVVLFSPADLVLIEGSPRRRRRFLDQALFGLNPGYLNYLGNYQQVLRNRNQLLRQESLRWEELEVWDESWVQSAAFIFWQRLQLVRELNQVLREKSARIQIEYLPSPRALLSVQPRSNNKDKGASAGILREKLKKLREKEKSLGFTLVGPQRDDFEVWSARGRSEGEGVNLAQFGSRGQQRLAVLQLKTVQLELLRKQIEESPILLLDDIFSELDRTNQQTLLEIMQNQQTLITATELEKIPTQLHSAPKIHLS